MTRPPQQPPPYNSCFPRVTAAVAAAVAATATVAAARC